MRIVDVEGQVVGRLVMALLREMTVLRCLSLSVFVAEAVEDLYLQLRIILVNQGRADVRSADCHPLYFSLK